MTTDDDRRKAKRQREQTPNEANRYRLAQAAKLIRLGLVERDESGEIVPTAEFAEHDAIEPDPEDFAQVEAEARRSFRQGDAGELGGEA